MSKYPTISVVVATYNSASTLSECLTSVEEQEYPSEKIELIIADGGSRDKTFLIAKKFHAKIIHVDRKKQGAEYNRAIGATKATGELLLFIDHDNVLPHTSWLDAMVQPLRDEPKVVGVETMYYTYDSNDSMIGRYFSLFGANDIFAYYVGKADRLAHFYTNPAQYGVFRKARVREKSGYFLVDFSKKHIPTLGSNGFLVRKQILFAHAKISPDDFFHIDVNVDLIRKGFTRYAFIQDSLHHKTDERGIYDYLYRRKLFMEKYHFGTMSRRRYSLYEKGDLWGTIRFVFLSMTFVVPLADSIRGYMRVRDIAWFINPIMCASLVILYGFAIIQRRIATYANIFMEK
jgi:glycosyltransferase involved in cell wall biosynthesis